jgi:hypothetical protein
MPEVKKGDTVLAIGTRKGLFFASSRDRRKWRLSEPHFAGIAVPHAILDPRDGRTVYASVDSNHWGPTIQRTTTFGARWLKDGTQPAYPKDSGLAVKRAWHVEPGVEEGEVWAGVEPAGLFHSMDKGKTWEGVEGMNAMEGRAEWMPGGGGLCMHTILPHPTDAKRITVAASSVGIFDSRDGGATWKLMNGAIKNPFSKGGHTEEHETGTCPHKLVRDPRDPGTLLMQNHWGQYRREEGDAKWTSIGKGLPSTFGFPLAVARDGRVFAAPLRGDFDRTMIDGAMAVWRSKPGGKGWERLSKGLSQKDAYLTVLREGLAVDPHDDVGVYVGTTGGQLYASRNAGDSWAEVASTLPPILSVEAGIAK